MPATLTKEQKAILKKLKDLSKAIADCVALAETDQNSSLLEDAIKAVDYYQRHYFNP